MTKHLIIPDTQVKPGIDLSYLSWIGQYIVDKKPDVIIHLGDHADMPSLSSYDKGKKSFEGRRYKADIKAAKDGMEALLNPMRQYNQKAAIDHKARYKPDMHFLLGNHEQRIERVAELQPEFDGVISYADLPYGDWQVHDFLKPVDIDGIMYVHYLANPMTGKPYSGTALNQLNKVHRSFVVGHKQTLDVCTSYDVAGRQRWGIVAGACYLHHEAYKGYQGNNHWRGIIMAHDVHDGSFDPMFVSLDYLKRRYG